MINNKFLQREIIRSSGFTLLEVLVALLILSIALLGLANLQMTGLQFSDNARQRSQAVYLAYDILDRMRANRDEVDAASYDVALGTAVAQPPANAFCTILTTTCTPTQLATYGLWEWKQDLDANLPNGDGSVVDLASATGTVYQITVQWDRKAFTDTDKATAQGTALTDSIVIETEL